jgi:3-oxoacyl-[acyl-carrier-protein] synthase I
MKRAVVITGLGAICAAGVSPEEVWTAVHNGHSSIAPLTDWVPADAEAPVAAVICDLDPRSLVDDRKLHKLLRRSDLLGLYAAGRAIAGANLIETRAALAPSEVGTFNDRTGIFVAAGGNYQNQYDFFPLLNASNGDLKVFGEELTSQVDPMWLLRTLPNNVLCHIGIRYGFKGPNTCFVNQSVGGALAIAEAAAALMDDEADRAVAVASDTPVEPQTILYYKSLGLLSEGLPRPFDLLHDGTALGEGAAAMVLETRASAERRGAAILGEILGFSCSSEAGGLLPLRHDGAGVARAIDNALQEAGLKPADVGMIVAHGNGTPNSDNSEAAALHGIFGSSPPPVTSFKWSIGHLFAAAGIIEPVLTLLCLMRGEAPGIGGFGEPDPACAGLRIAASSQPVLSDIAIVLSRGLGSISTALVLRAPAGGVR